MRKRYDEWVKRTSQIEKDGKTIIICVGFAKINAEKTLVTFTRYYTEKFMLSILESLQCRHLEALNLEREKENDNIPHGVRI